MREVRTPTTHLANLRKMEKNLSEYVCLDGVYFKEEQLVKMAINAGSFAVAEHYLCAYLAHGLMYGKMEVIDKVNEVREQYDLLPYKKPEEQMRGVRSGFVNRKESVEFKVRKAYGNMSDAHRREVMKSCLMILRAQSNLFNHKNDWLSVMLVVRDRLDGNINQNNFYDYACDITPENWPNALRISEHTPKNFSRLLNVMDRTEAYYDMEENPQEDLCIKLWDIVIETILTEIP